MNGPIEFSAVVEGKPLIRMRDIRQVTAATSTSERSAMASLEARATAPPQQAACCLGVSWRSKALARLVELGLGVCRAARSSEKLCRLIDLARSVVPSKAYGLCR